MSNSKLFESQNKTPRRIFVYLCVTYSFAFAPLGIADSGKFTLEGADHPGIVHRVTTILSRNGLSIDKMETSDEIAPYGGTTLFRMRGIANAQEPLAAGFNPSKVKEQLRQLGDDMNCDIEMEDVADDEYQGSFYV